jgi:hypothetical protein
MAYASPSKQEGDVPRRQATDDYFGKIYTNFDKQKSPELNGSSLSSAKR